MDKRILFLGVALLLGVAGCKSGDDRAQKKALGTLPAENYPPLTRYNLELTLAGKRDLEAGKPGKVTFVLTNADSEPIKLREWFSHEADNVLVYCQPWLPGTDAPDDNSWTPLTFDLHNPPIRYPLELFPGNRVSVTKELRFIENLVVSPGAERRYFIKGVLNLKSGLVSSPVAAIAVHPAR